MDKTQIRDAATVILIRDGATKPSVLMGQRGSQAAFMPNKFVFPGGAVDAGDRDIALVNPLPMPCRDRINSDAPTEQTKGLAATAIRELWEETGLILGKPGTWDNPPSDWRSFAATGHLPSASALNFVFRAITPPGPTRRFDARFFLADAAALAGDPDDFGAASEELSHLQWIPFSDVRSYNLPFITKVVLAEVAQMVGDLRAPDSVPFFKNDDERSLFERIGETGP